MMVGQYELAAGTLGPGAPVFDVAGKTLLSQVEIDRGDALPEIQEGDGDVHGECGLFPRPLSRYRAQ
jgi:hypothetical protein